MSTRCYIGIKNKDNTITAIYCHHDGYISGGVGDTLKEHYLDERKVRQLMCLGDISALGIFPLAEKDFEKVFGFNRVPNEIKTRGGSSFGNDTIELKFKFPNGLDYVGCDDYGTVEGPEDTSATTFKDEAEYMEATNNSDREYAYLYENGKWRCYSKYNNSKFSEF